MRNKLFLLHGREKSVSVHQAPPGMEHDIDALLSIVIFKFVLRDFIFQNKLNLKNFKIKTMIIKCYGAVIACCAEGTRHREQNAQ